MQMKSARYVGSKKLTDKILSGRQAGRHDVLVVVSAQFIVWSIKHRGQWVGVLKGDNILFNWDLHDLGRGGGEGGFYPPSLKSLKKC